MVNKMSKYYDKEIPTNIHCVYGSRHYGKTYREFKKIEKILDYFRKFATISENTMISVIEDYITNLQEELYELKGDYSIVVTGYKKLKFAMQDTYDSANDTCGELQQRIEELETDLKAEERTSNDLAKRLLNVKKYVKRNKTKYCLGRDEFTCELKYSDELVKASEVEDILKGEKNE